MEITSPQPSDRLQGRVEITGYAADRRSPRGSGLNERDIAIYLNSWSDERTLFYYAAPGQPSPAAVAALGPQFDRVGFRATWDTCAFPPGPYQVIVWASSLFTPGGRQFASLDVEVAACPPAGVLHEDDFASAPGGVYTVRLIPPSAYNGDGAIPIFADFAVGIDARCLQPDPSCFYGLLLRVLPGPGDDFTSTGYAFFIDPLLSTFWLAYFPTGADPSRYELVIAPTRSPAIRSGTALNRLAVIAQGDAFQLFINGQPVGEGRDASRPWGRIGWGASTLAVGRSVEAQFANLVVASPGPVEALASVLAPTESRSQPDGGAQSSSQATSPADRSQAAGASAGTGSQPGGAAAPVAADQPANSPESRGAPAAAIAPANPLEPFQARLDGIQSLLERGDCQGATLEFLAILTEGPARLVQAGLSMEQIEQLQTRLDQLVFRMQTRC